MAKYKEVTITGSQWVQLGKAKIFFDPDKPTRIEFSEELVRQLEHRQIIQNVREITLTLDVPTTKFDLVDPDDNTATGDMSYRQLEKALYSLYYAEAIKLDQQG